MASNFKNASSLSPNQPIVISVSSGKGGVGKSLTVVQLALAYARQGASVLVVDGDLGLSNVEVILNLKPNANLQHVLNGEVHLRETIIKGPFGIHVISSGSGLAEIQNMSFFHKQIFMSQIKDLPQAYDYVIVDTPAGIGSHVVHFNQMADFHLVVTTPDPHALTDAYALVKVLSELKIGEFHLVVNMTSSFDEGKKIAERIQKVARDFLAVPVEYLGCVPFDRDLSASLLRRNIDQRGQSLSGQAWSKIAAKLATYSMKLDLSQKRSKLYEMIFP